MPGSILSMQLLSLSEEAELEAQLTTEQSIQQRSLSPHPVPPVTGWATQGLRVLWLRERCFMSVAGEGEIWERASQRMRHWGWVLKDEEEFSGNKWREGE